MTLYNRYGLTSLVLLALSITLPVNATKQCDESCGYFDQKSCTSDQECESMVPGTTCSTTIDDEPCKCCAKPW